MTQSVSSQMAQSVNRTESSVEVANNNAAGVNKVIFSEQKGNYWVVFILNHDSKEKEDLLWFKGENIKQAMKYCFVLHKRTGLRISHNCLTQLSQAYKELKENKEPEYYVDGNKVTEEEARLQERENERLQCTGEPEDLLKMKEVRKAV